MTAERKRIRRTQRWPEGLIYRAEFLTQEQEKLLVSQIQRLPFESALYHGYVAKRRIVAFGVDYSFETRKVTPGPPMPEFLNRLRERVAELAPGIRATDLVEGLVTEYQPGTTIGWHRDAPQFGIVIGISLASSCRMRLRLATKDEYETTALLLQPRSAYVFQGEARWKWQHSIPAVEQLRYSITFRTLRSGVELSAMEEAA